MSKILEATILAEEITYYFEEKLEGMYSDVAWYDILEKCYGYRNGDYKENQLINHLEFVFGFDGKKDFDVVLKKANKRLKKLEKELHG